MGSGLAGASVKWAVYLAYRYAGNMAELGGVGGFILHCI